jgi:hypothetical protein
MATTATTLAGAIKADDWYVQLASATGLKAGDSIVCEQESMRVLVPGNPVPNAAIVYRGARGTAGKPHAAAVACTYGGPTDYGVGVGVLTLEQRAVAEFMALSEAKADAAKFEEATKKYEAAKEAEAKAEAAKAEAAAKAAERKEERR